MSRLVNKINEMSGLLYRKAGDKWSRYERHISSLALLTGFVIDNFTLQRIDQAMEHVIFIVYLSIAGAGITFTQLYRAGRLGRTHGIRQPSKFLTFAQNAVPIVIQFAFGGLFSGFLIFYSRSSSLASSWLFLLILVSLLIGNEFFRERYKKLSFQLTIYFTAIYSYTIFAVPVVLKTISTATFLLSGTVSVIIITVFVKLLEYVTPTSVRECRRTLIISIAGVLAFINGLYFLNIIPPIPLSLKDAGAYHFMERTSDGRYMALEEDQPWYAFLRPYETITIREGAPIYVYSAIFAPTELKTDIEHLWQYYDEEDNRWRDRHTTEFAITGGRENGYRVFSLTSYPTPGRWRVRINTGRGRVIGIVNLRMLKSEGAESPEIERVEL